MNSSSAIVQPSLSSYYDEFDSPKAAGLYIIPPSLAIVLTFIYMSVSLCAVIANSMVLWVIIGSRRMHSVTNMFIANIAISDICIGGLAIPFQFQAALLQKWLLPSFFCSFCPTVQIVSVNVSIFTLVALSCDRYRIITQPLKQRLTCTDAFIINVIIWIVSISTALPTFIAYQVQDILMANATSALNETVSRCQTTGLSSQVVSLYNRSLFTMQYLIPSVLMTFCYCRIALVLAKNVQMMHVSQQNCTRTVESKKRVIKMLLLVIFVFAICWLPFQLYNILQEIYHTINE